MKATASGGIVNITMSNYEYYLRATKPKRKSKEELAALVRKFDGDLDKASDSILKQIAPVLKNETKRNVEADE